MAQVRRKSKNFSLIQFLFGSIVADSIIVVNCILFWFLYMTEEGKGIFEYLILYPGNLVKGYVWTILTSGFVHGDLAHLLWNMLGIFVFARVVEEKLGIMKTFYIYFGSLILSMGFSLLVYTFIIKESIAIVGASGALMGLISAAMLIAPFKITYEMLLPFPIMIKAWMFFYADLQGVLNNVKDGVSHIAHLFGFLSIAVLVYYLSPKDRKMFQSGLWVNVFSFSFFLILSYWIHRQGIVLKFPFN